MAISIRQVGPCFAGEISGIDIREPLGDHEIAAIHAGMDEHGVLVFRDQPLTADQQLSFTRSLGSIEQTLNVGLRKPEEYRLPPVFADVSNLDVNDKPMSRDDRRRLFAIGNQLWHSDSSFKVTPAKYSLLHSLSVTSKGGNTEFADMRAAYDALDDEMKAQCEGLICQHSQIYSRQQIGFFDLGDEDLTRYAPVLQTMVRSYPGTGRKSLYLSSHAGGIVGWPVPEARIFLRNLIEHATQREFVHVHEWGVGDLVIWDNRQTMHRVRSFPVNEARNMRRTTIAGDGPTVQQAAA